VIAWAGPDVSAALSTLGEWAAAGALVGFFLVVITAMYPRRH
jgi:hypothetical protein